MMHKPVIAVLLLTFVSACAAKDTRIEVLQALDTQPDGYSGVYGNPPKTFSIRETMASDTKLCRVVVLSEDGSANTARTQVESFCKVRGGKWR